MAYDSIKGNRNQYRLGLKIKKRPDDVSYLPAGCILKHIYAFIFLLYVGELLK